MRRFAKIELSFDKVPDETTILRFRHPLEKDKPTKKTFEATKGRLESRRMSLYSGNIVDTTIVAAPSSTKNELNARDPEIKQTNEGQEPGLRIDVPCRDGSTGN